MAIRLGDTVMIDESGYLSDESDFFGDEITKHEFEARADAFNVTEWWKRHLPTLMEVADVNIKTETPAQAVKLYNPYEGRRDAWQLSETIEQFLTRLPPRTTQQSGSIPWIYITNPYRKTPKEVGADDHSQTGEGPPEEASRWGKCTKMGYGLLQELTEIRVSTEKRLKGKAKATVTKAIAKEKDRIVREILDTAKSLKCTSGKWMLFSDVEEVNEVWAVVAKATANDELGIAAKVAPDDGGNSRAGRLMCIYTKDFTDTKDVKRVLTKMKDLGLVDSREKPIYYKCDAYTYLGLKSANEYGIRASLYNSKDMFQAKDERQLANLFYNKKRNDGDWRPLEWE